ncbi:MAG: hypothetical protein HC860_22220 [Alkalinema sp. RU_4_3]|nr:hypothetical protein [Alkalinema sp. RU_4_3]
MATTTPEILTLEQIRHRYDGEWVLIAYNEIDHNLTPVSGEVLAHSPDRDTLYASLSLGRGKDVAIECFVKVPEDMAFIL